MNKITNALAEAAEKAFTALFDEHKENFYYCSFIISENSTPYICAWSYEALDRFVNALGITDKTQLEEEREIYKWSYADSPYNAYGYNKYFTDVDKLFKEHWDNNADNEAFEEQFELWINSMEEAMAALDKKGLFGTASSRNKVVINAEVMPPDCTNTERAKRLNPKRAIKQWLEEAAEEDDDNSLSRFYTPCEVTLIKAIDSPKMIVSLKSNFKSKSNMKEFLSGCKNPPFVIRNDVYFGEVENIIKLHPEYKTFIRVKKKLSSRV